MPWVWVVNILDQRIVLGEMLVGEEGASDPDSQDGAWRPPALDYFNLGSRVVYSKSIARRAGRFDEIWFLSTLQFSGMGILSGVAGSGTSSGLETLYD